MFSSTSEFFSASEACVSAFNTFALKHDLVGKVKADHICYKCDTFESFESIRALFELESNFIYQSIISGRRIAIVRFKEGIASVLGTINYLELSDQKLDGSQKEGFDHIEAYPTTFSYEAFVSQLGATEEVVTVSRPHHTTDDVIIDGGFIFRCTVGPLIEKIKQSEIV